jgi:hypothetical protein
MENQAKDLEKSMDELDKACDVNYQPNVNMLLWEKVCKTDPAVTKKMTYGAKLTAICAQSQLKKATELWGCFGSKWGIKEEKFNILEKICFYIAILYYPGGQLLVHSDIEIIKSGKYNEDWTKKVATDALTKGLSKLGFNSDVFEGKFDDNKYIESLNNKPAANKNANISQQNPQIDINSSYDQLLLYIEDPKVDNDDKKKINAHLSASPKAQDAFLKYLDKKYGG